MKSCLVIMMSMLFLTTSAQVIQLGINQADPLEAHAGADTLLCKNHSILLGSELSATGGTPDYSYVWYPNVYLDNNTLARPTCTPEEATTYILTVTDKFGCTASSYVTIAIDPCLSTGIIWSEESITIFPNPVQDKLKIIGLPFTQGHVKLTLVNGLGQEVMQRDIDYHKAFGSAELELQVAHVPKGMYLLRIIVEGQSFVKSIQLF